VTQINSSPFIVKGNRRQKIRRTPDTTLREALSVTTVIDHPLVISDNVKSSSPSHPLRMVPANTTSSELLLSNYVTMDTGLTVNRRPTPDEFNLRRPNSQFITHLEPVVPLPDYLSVSSMSSLNSSMGEGENNSVQQSPTFSTEDNYCIPPDDYEHEPDPEVDFSDFYSKPAVNHYRPHSENFVTKKRRLSDNTSQDYY